MDPQCKRFFHLRIFCFCMELAARFMSCLCALSLAGEIYILSFAEERWLFHDLSLSLCSGISFIANLRAFLIAVSTFEF